MKSLSMALLMPLTLSLSLLACSPAPVTQIAANGSAPSPSASPASAIASPTPTTVPAQPATPSAAPSPHEHPATSPAPAASEAPPAPAQPAAPVPAKPSGLLLVENSPSQLTLQWDFAMDARSYRLWLDGKPVSESHTTPNYYSFQGLNAGTEYSLGVQAVNGDGVPGETTVMKISTLTDGRYAVGNFSSVGNGNTRPKPVSFETALAIFQNRCSGCHGDDVGSYEALREFGVYDDHEPGELIKEYVSTGYMPRGSAGAEMSDSERDKIVRWIKQGMTGPIED